MVRFTLDQENLKQQEGKNAGKQNKRFLCTWRFHTCVFSICQKCPRATALTKPSLRRTHSYGNLPYNIEIALGLPPSCNPPLGEPTHMGTSPTTLRIKMIQAKCTGIGIYAIHV
jgi:hypothetical protein